MVVISGHQHRWQIYNLEQEKREEKKEKKGGVI